MYDRSALVQQLDALRNIIYEYEYNTKKIMNIIRRYQELRCATEITAAQYEKVGNGTGSGYGKDDILCMLADIDRGAAALSSQQLKVVRLLERGYQTEEIGKMLGLRPITVRFHIRQAIIRLTAYLNSSKEKEKGAKR